MGRVRIKMWLQMMCKYLFFMHVQVSVSLKKQIKMFKRKKPSLKLKTLVICNKFDHCGNIQIKFHVVYVTRVWIQIRKVRTGKLNQVFDINFHLSLPPCKSFIFIQLVDPQISCGCINTGQKVYIEGLHREFKMNNIDFAILSSHVTVSHILKIYQKHSFYAVKEKKFKKLYFSVLLIFICRICI